MEKHKQQVNRMLRKQRIRTSVKGTTERPRLSISISNRHVSAQIIDDSVHKTLASATTVGVKKVTGNMTELAKWVGSEIAQQASKAKVVKVVLDRNGKRYHGRIAALAQAAREGGLDF
jgi:large subunit ribosomal protein L18